MKASKFSDAQKVFIFHCLVKTFVFRRKLLVRRAWRVVRKHRLTGVVSGR